MERLTSIVKELLENAIDAGATDIRIDVEKGGAKCIRVSDNGSGISKDDLTQALMRHATSKISSLEDLLECRLSAEGDNRPVSQPLLMPVRLKLNREERELLRLWQPDLEQSGIRFTVYGHGVVFSGVPAMIREQPLTLLLGKLAEWLSRESEPETAPDSARVSR